MRLETGALDAARAARVAVDRELTGFALALNVLSLSRSLRDGDLAGFHQQVSQMRDRLGMVAVLRDASGR